MRIDYQNAILLVLCLVLLLSVFSMSASAANQILPISTDPLNDGLVFGHCVDGNKSWNEVVSSDVESVLVGVKPQGQLNPLVYAFSRQVGNAYYTYTMAPTWNVPDVVVPLESYNRLYKADIPSFPNNSKYTYYVDNIFTTLEEAYSYALSVLPPYSSFQYSLPPGNIAFIQVPVGASYTLNTRMPESVLGTNHYPGNNQVITLVNSLPSGGTAPSSPLIPWQQDGALSVLGLSRNATYSGTNASAGYLCIVNPLYYSGTANGPYEFLSNGSIDITIDRQTGIWVYPLDSTLGFTSGLGINVDTEIIDNPFTGTVDPDTGEITWEDSSGGSTAPITGGGNLVSTSETIFDFLRNIADEISTFLKGPIQAIQTVVAAIRQFLSSFTQLYMWLPAPVYNLITSALMIALTIGVIKIFV